MMKSKLTLGFYPTPMHKLENLSAHYNPLELYIKRDDQTGLASGGNKTRKLEYLMADAIGRDFTCIITMGAQQSNHCRQTAAACAVYGLDCHLVFRGEEPAEFSGNLLLCKILGAKLYFAGTQNPDAFGEYLAKELDKKGLQAYLIPLGGSNIVGMLGYIDAVQELMMQQKVLKIQFDYIFFASCSGGTQAGLMVGQRMYDLKAKLMPVGIQKAESGNTPIEEIVLSLCNDFTSHHSQTKSFYPSDVEVVKGYDAPGYGVVTENEKKVMHRLAASEGILIDPVYTARAFFAMIDCIENGGYILN